MSLLADLLSRKKPGASPDGAKTSSPLNVPPTLSKARGGIPANVRKLNNRYVIIAVVCVVFIALGAFLASKSGVLRSVAEKKPPLPPQALQQQQPVPFKAASSIAAAPLAVSAPTEQAKARITLEEPPAHVPVLQKKKIRSHKAKKVKCPPPKAAVKSLPTPSAVSPAEKVERPQQQTSIKPGQKVVASRKIDTAARDSLLYAARSAEQVSDWKMALSSYRRAQEIDPDDYKMLSNMAAVLNNLGMFDDAVIEAEKALVKKPDYVPALINAAIGYSSRGNTQKALRHFTHASAIEPGNRSLIINLGILHERSGNFDDALATYRPLASSGDPLVLNGMGRVYERKGNKGEAIRIYRQIMALSNASPAMKKEAKGKIARLEE
jgi:Flp pilus assembly protein TadD